MDDMNKTAVNDYSNIPVKYYCEYCGSELLDNGRCPTEDCIHNLILDVLGDENAESEG